MHLVHLVLGYNALGLNWKPGMCTRTSVVGNEFQYTSQIPVKLYSASDLRSRVLQDLLEGSGPMLASPLWASLCSQSQHHNFSLLGSSLMPSERYLFSITLIFWLFSAGVCHRQSGNHNGLQNPVRYGFKFHLPLLITGWPWANCSIFLNPVIFLKEVGNTCPAGLIWGLGIIYVMCLRMFNIW